MISLRQGLSVAAVTLLMSLSVGGCKSSPPAAASASATAGTPAAAPADTTAAAPASAPAPTPAAPTAAAPTIPTSHTPMATQPASSTATVAPVAGPPSPPLAPVVVKRTAPVGASVKVMINQQLSASKSDVGNIFTGELTSSLKTKDGAVVYPKGTKVQGSVVAAKGQGRFKGSGALGIQITRIGGQTVSTTEYEQQQKGKGKRTAGFIGGGAGGGALIGGLAGGGKGALIGGLIGAGAGTAGAAFTGNKDVVLPAETVVLFQLTAPVTVSHTE